MSDEKPSASGDVPEFIRDACDDLSEVNSAQIVESMERLLTDPASTLLPDEADPEFSRLMAAVESLPVRYAPFYNRLGELFDLREPEVEQLLSRTDWTSTGLPGIRVRDVEGGPRRKGCELRLVNFSAGAYFPRHVHKGLERIFIVEGGYRDASGVDYGPGDLHEMEEGSSHSFRIHDEGPCIAASVLGARFQFESWPLRMLDKIFRG